jgi:hypothetical protein
MKSDHNTDTTQVHGTIQLLIDVVQTQTGPKLDNINARIQDCLKEIEVLRQNLPLTRGRAILTWLNFRQMSWRYEEIPLAYQETFKWIFKKPTADERWDDFLAHLEGNASIPYFINGKAGSGKSTLMKYVVDNPVTKTSLAKWAAMEKHELIVAKFFFWNLGTPLQKGTVGLLRALLFTILQKYPELIPVVFPDVYQNWQDDMSQPSYAEVKMAWKLLLEKSAKYVKLAIFIDGLDEFEGDHKDIAEFIYSLASPKVKIVISSRPINACLHVFRQCPGLRLQGLTMRDMEVFVEGNLVSHQTMVQMSRQYPTDTREIVSEIQEKAEGVFLWVRLVVRLLVDGLESGDSMIDLRKSLRSLPRDLRDIYRRMISKINVQLQVQAAQIFQLLQTWQSVISAPMTTILLHFALQPPSEGISPWNRPLDEETLAWYLQQTAARIRSRCCGLLEVHGRFDYKPLQTKLKTVSLRMTRETANDSTVNYLHRTVAEFLISDDVSKEMQTMTGPSFDPRQHITSACLSMVRISGSSPEKIGLFDYFKNMLQVYKDAPSASREILNEYITALDETMTRYQNEPYEGQVISIERSSHWSMALENVVFDFEFDGHRVATYEEQESNPENFEQAANIFTFAARLGFHQYLKASYRDGLSDPSILMLFALETWVHPSKAGIGHRAAQFSRLKDRGETLLFLLQYAVKPETKLFGKPLFTFALRYLKYFGSQEELGIFLASFITTSQSPHDLIRSGGLTIRKAARAANILKNNDDSLFQDLGYKMDQIITRVSSSNQPKLQQHQLRARIDSMTLGNGFNIPYLYGNNICAPYLDQATIPHAILSNPAIDTTIRSPVIFSAISSYPHYVVQNPIFLPRTSQPPHSVDTGNSISGAHQSSNIRPGSELRANSSR